MIPLFSQEYVREMERRSARREGLEEGLQEGLQEGQQNEFEKNVRSMRKAGLANSKIAALLEKCVTDVESVK